MHELIKKEIKENQERITKRINNHAYTPAISLFIIERNVETSEEKILNEETIRDSWYHYLSEKSGKIEKSHIHGGLFFLKENLVEKEGYKLSYHLVDFKNNKSEVFFVFNIETFYNKICQITDSHSDDFLSSYKTFNAMLNSIRDFTNRTSLLQDDMLKESYKHVLSCLSKKDNQYSTKISEKNALLIKHIDKLHSMLGYGKLSLSFSDRYNEKDGGEILEITDNVKLKICEIISLKSRYDFSFKITFTGTNRFNNLYSEMKEKLEEERQLKRQKERDKRDEEPRTYTGGFGISN